MLKFININYEAHQKGFKLNCRMSACLLEQMPYGIRKNQDINAILADIKRQAVGKKLVKGCIPPSQYRPFALNYVGVLCQYRGKPTLLICEQSEIEELTEVVKIA